MTRWAIGDIQGCDDEFGELLQHLSLRSDRDQLWLVGDLVNRGPQSLQVLRRLRAMGDSAICVLGNHDLHLLAVAAGHTAARRHDTLDAILAAPDREALIDWLQQRPLLHHQDGDVLLHAGVVPPWDLQQCVSLAREVEAALHTQPQLLLGSMYGDEPDRWQTGLDTTQRLRFTINVLTRLRFCTVGGRVNLKYKGTVDSAPPPWLPWFETRPPLLQQARVVFGHWSALGLQTTPHYVALDTGCVWGGSLTAVDLDDPGKPPVTVPSRQPHSRES